METKDKVQLMNLLVKLQEEVHVNARVHGFWDTEDSSVPQKIALIHSEVSEALEAYRKGNPADHHIPRFTNFTVELADVIIRILDLAGGANLPLAEALMSKIHYNSTRDFLHGKKC